MYHKIGKNAILTSGLVCATLVIRMNKKQNPRTEFIIVRVSKAEKKKIQTESLETHYEFSDYIRFKLLGI